MESNYKFQHLLKYINAITQEERTKALDGLLKAKFLTKTEYNNLIKEVNKQDDNKQ